MDLNNKRIMVVGGAGLIGSHVVDELLKTGVKEILVYDNMFRGNSHNLEEAMKDPRVKINPHGGEILHEDILEVFFLVLIKLLLAVNVMLRPVMLFLEVQILFDFFVLLAGELLGILPQL